MSCLHTVDLRDPDRVGADTDAVVAGDATSRTGTRLNPATGTYDTCKIDDPLELCPCAYTTEAAPFPYCDGSDVKAVCETTCTGDINVCNGYNASTGFADDCVLLIECCGRLQQAGAFCCSPLETFSCVPRSGVINCLDNSCCETMCNNISDCDFTFQTCVGGLCKPGCEVAEFDYCVDDGSCVCNSVK